MITADGEEYFLARPVDTDQLEDLICENCGDDLACDGYTWCTECLDGRS